MINEALILLFQALKFLVISIGTTVLFVLFIAVVLVFIDEFKEFLYEGNVDPIDNEWIDEIEEKHIW